MTCYCCGNLDEKNGQGNLSETKGTHTHTSPETAYALPAVCFYTVTRPCPALRVCKQVCVCAYIRDRKRDYSLMDACFLESDVFTPETLYCFLSVHFPNTVRSVLGVNQVKSSELIRLYYFSSKS